ncbi:MAG TPA: hypothetical protein VF727_03165 [Allosphingosinicella sp.]|jgi:hypothetical protein
MTNVADLELDGPDALGERILSFFGRKPPHYAVYGIRRRVAVHFADDAEEANGQRKILAQLAPLRGEIDGLIDGWRDGSSNSFFGLENAARLRSKADRYERRVGDALVLALEDDVPDATATLQAIKQDIINERTAWARFEYLIAAFATAMIVMFIAFLICATYPWGDAEAAHRRMIWVAVVLVLFASAAGAAAFLAGRERDRRTASASEIDEQPPEAGGDIAAARFNGRRTRLHPVAQQAAPLGTGILLFLLLAIPVFAVFIAPSFSHMDNVRPFSTPIDLWRAASGGAVGAFFSIAVGIRTRTVLPDLLRTSNIMDAVLRVTIGFIAGAVLLAMLRLNVVTVKIGTTPIADVSPLGVVLVGFFAGFSERLVPDLLEKAKASTGGSLVRSAAQTTVTPTPAATAAATAGAESPDTKAAAPDAPAAGPPAVDPLPEQAGEDGCASDIDLEDDEVTSDAELPAAAGGVERPVEGGNP